jgi:hypothetical protein
MAEDDVRIEHPNRRKASSKASRAVVILLLLVSAALVLIVTIGGWDALQGAKLLQIAYILIYLGMAFYVARWNRGVLPVAAALAIILLIFAAVQALLIVFSMQAFSQEWNVEVERRSDGSTTPAPAAG